MKRLTIFVCTLLLVLACFGCSKNTDSDEPMNEVAANKWGITLEAEQVTASGLTLVCHQSGGEAVADLMTGSYYAVQRLEDSEYTAVDCLSQEDEIVWTMEAWGIQKGNTTRWDVNWTWLYGELPAGEYRIGKRIMNFRGTGDYDEEMVYANFVIE